MTPSRIGGTGFYRFEIDWTATLGFRIDRSAETTVKREYDALVNPPLRRSRLPASAMLSRRLLIWHPGGEEQVELHQAGRRTDEPHPPRAPR